MKSGSIAPRILNVGTRWPQPGAHRTGCWVGFRAALDAMEEGA